jgi:hypothetical protein
MSPNECYPCPRTTHPKGIEDLAKMEYGRRCRENFQHAINARYNEVFAKPPRPVAVFVIGRI